MGIIIVLILAGLLLLVTEIILLPGISVAGIAAILAYVAATVIGFMRYGMLGGGLTLTAIVIVTVVAVIISLRANTWRRLTLNSTIDSTSIPTPAQQHIQIGEEGTALTRLAPMGKVQLSGKIIEAKSLDCFIDQRTRVTVVGFDNTVIVVRPVDNSAYQPTDPSCNTTSTPTGGVDPQ